jgi:hypothetical protein
MTMMVMMIVLEDKFDKAAGEPRRYVCKAGQDS